MKSFFKKQMPQNINKQNKNRIFSIGMMFCLNLSFLGVVNLSLAQATSTSNSTMNSTSKKAPGRWRAQNDQDLNELGSSGVDRNELLDIREIKPSTGVTQPAALEGRNPVREPSSLDIEGRSPDAINKAKLQSVVPMSSPLPPGMGLRDGAILSSGLIEKIYTTQIKIESPTQARKKMMDEAVAKTSEALVMDIMGPLRYQKNRSQIYEKVSKYTGRFIPVMKTSDLIKDAEGNYQLTITMNVNLKILESMLKESGLLYENDTTPLILPLVSFVDRLQNQEFRWWRQLRTPAETLYLQIEKQMQQGFMDQGFYMERPQASNLGLLRPESLNKDHLLPEDWVPLTALFKATAIVEGEIRVVPAPTSGESQVEVQLTARQVNTGRVLAELYRKSTWERSGADIWTQRKLQQWMNDTLKDLALQVKESWARGTFSSSVLKLVVRGGLPLSRYQKFKEQIQSQSKAVRQIRERVIGADELVFEIDFNGNLNDVASELQTVRIDELLFQQERGADTQSITLVRGKVSQ